MKLLIAAVVSFFLLIIPWPIAPLHWIALALYLGCHSYSLGQKYSPTGEKFFRFLFGLLLTLSVLMIGGTLSFYAWSITKLALILIAFIPTALVALPYQNKATATHDNWSWSSLVLPLLHLVSGGLLLWFVGRHATVEPIQSPWLIIPLSAYVLMAVTSFCALVIVTHQTIPAWLKMISLSWHTFICTCLALLIYPLGFGFDPFIHQATEKILLLTGTIHPKPYYYLGHYTLVVWIQTWSQLPLALIDRWLLPLLTALLLPTIIYYSFRCNFRSEPRALALLPLSLFLLPYPFFIQTTPQGLSLLWSLLLIMLSLFYIHRQQLSAVWLLVLAAAALTLHPLSGIPMVLYTILLVIYHRSWEAKKLVRVIRFSLYGILTIIAALAMPLVFALQARLSPTTASSVSLEDPQSPLWQLPHYYRFIRWDDLLYLFDGSAKLLLFLLAAIGCWYVIRHRRAHYFAHYLVTYLVLISNYILLTLYVHFDFLLPYERQSYPERILTLSYFFLWPFAFIALYWLAKKILQSGQAIRTIVLLLLTGILTCSWYLSYPRFDYYSQNKGFNTSTYDLAAVDWIRNVAGNKPYIVLANQSVSAAAVQTLGFEPSYRGHYLYPIPTGDPLYQSYLDAVYNRKATASILQDVKALTGVSDVYLVVNDYWSGYEDIIQRLKKSATTSTAISGGRIYIFTFSTR